MRKYRFAWSAFVAVLCCAVGTACSSDPTAQARIDADLARADRIACVVNAASGPTGDTLGRVGGTVAGYGVAANAAADLDAAARVDFQKGCAARNGVVVPATAALAPPAAK